MSIALIIPPMHLPRDSIDRDGCWRGVFLAHAAIPAMRKRGPRRHREPKVFFFPFFVADQAKSLLRLCNLVRGFFCQAGLQLADRKTSLLPPPPLPSKKQKTKNKKTKIKTRNIRFSVPSRTRHAPRRPKKKQDKKKKEMVKIL